MCGTSMQQHLTALDMASFPFSKWCHILFSDWSFSLGPGRRTAWRRASTWPCKTLTFVIISYSNSGALRYVGITKPILTYTFFSLHSWNALGFSIWGEMRSWKWKSPLGLGSLRRSGLFVCFKEERWCLKSRVEGVLSIILPGNGKFSFLLLRVVDCLSYLHSSSRQMAQTGWGWIMRQAWKEEHKGALSGPEEPTPGMMDGSAHGLSLLLHFRLFPCTSAGHWILFPLWKSPSSCFCHHRQLHPTGCSSSLLKPLSYPVPDTDTHCWGLAG